MLRALLPKANDSNPTVASNVMTCLGELVCVAGEDAMPNVPDLMRVIIDRLNDPALVKRDAALHTLGQVCSSTGYVIQPLVDYPQLLPTLVRILRTENTVFAKREVVKVLGILGALDPFRRKVMSDPLFKAYSLSNCSKSKTQEEPPPEPAEAPAGSASAVAAAAAAAQANVAVGTDDYFQTAVITSLLAVLKDPSLSGHHHTVIEAIMSIFKTQGLKCVTFLPQVCRFPISRTYASNE